MTVCREGTQNTAKLPFKEKRSMLQAGNLLCAEMLTVTQDVLEAYILDSVSAMEVRGMPGITW